MKPIGRTSWSIPGGWIPLGATGPEPTFTSRESIAVLNAGDEMANVRMTLLYADREPVDGYRITVAARRVRVVRMNDLIFPHAMPLETPYAAVITSDMPVVVQFTRQDTRQRAGAWMGTIAFPGDG
jgi:hypothetical protein